jgi:hypothetical protein
MESWDKDKYTIRIRYKGKKGVLLELRIRKINE